MKKFEVARIGMKHYLSADDLATFKTNIEAVELKSNPTYHHPKGKRLPWLTVHNYL